MNQPTLLLRRQEFSASALLNSQSRSELRRVAHVAGSWLNQGAASNL